MSVYGWVIFGLGMADFMLMIAVLAGLRKVVNEFRYIRRETDYQYRERIEAKGDLVTTAHSEVRYNRDKLEANRDDYYGIYPWYVFASQSVALFPLLGILGTVWGLASGNLADVATLVSGLGMALDTTIYGLCCAIGLKFVDAFFLGRLVNRVDSEFEKADSAINRQSLNELISLAMGVSQRQKLSREADNAKA